MISAEELRNKYWTGHKQYSIYRKGHSDGIVVLIDNPPCSKRRSPMIDFLIFKNGIEVDFASTYEDMRQIVEKLKYKKNLI